MAESRSGKLGNVPADCHPKVRQMLDHWLAIHPASGLLGRQHVDPVDFPTLLPNIRLIDAVGHPPRFRVRLCGEELRRHFGQSFVGEYLDEVYSSFRQRASYRDLMAAFESKQPRWTRDVCDLSPDKDFVAYERVVLPLAQDGENVDMLIVLSLFEVKAEPTMPQTAITTVRFG